MSSNSISGDDWAKRKEFMMITPELCATLPQVWETIKPELPDILDGFYAHAGSVPTLAEMVGNQSTRLKAAQTTQ